MDWEGLLGQLGSTAIIVAVLGFVAKRVVEQWLASRLEGHKNDLTQASQRAREILRYELRLAEAQQGRLLARQANIVAGTFLRLERLHQALGALAAPIQHKTAGARPLRDAAVQAFNDLGQYYHERGIWLDVKTLSRLNDLMLIYRELLTQMDYNLLPDGQIADRQRWLKSYHRLQEDVPLARQSLERQFRRLLGVAGAEPELENGEAS